MEYGTLTWGPGTCGSDYDAVMGDNNGFGSQGYLGGLFLDDTDSGGYGWKCVGLRFPYVNIPNADLILSATLVLYRVADNNGANGTTQLKCEDSNTPGTYDNGRRPYNQSYRAAYVNHGFPNNGDTQYIQVGTLIQNLLDGGYSYSGAASDAIAFSIMGSLAGLPSISWRYITRDYSVYTGSVIQLNIVYATSISDGTTQLLSSALRSSHYQYGSAWILQSVRPTADDGTSAGIVRFLLQTADNPIDQRSKELRYRFWKEGTTTQNLIMRLYEASTYLASGTHLNVGTDIVQGSFFVTGTISNWGSVIVEVEGYQ